MPLCYHHGPCFLQGLMHLDSYPCCCQSIRLTYLHTRQKLSRTSFVATMTGYPLQKLPLSFVCSNQIGVRLTWLLVDLPSDQPAELYCMRH